MPRAGRAKRQAVFLVVFTLFSPPNFVEILPPKKNGSEAKIETKSGPSLGIISDQIFDLFLE